jgi:phosphohistidine phosphatase SixA/ketosteroid isomerase-like protein
MDETSTTRGQMRFPGSIAGHLLVFTLAFLAAACATAQTAAQTAARSPATASPTTIVVVRHAEKSTDDPRDPSLSAIGQERANALGVALKDAGVTDIYVTQYKRTRQTAEPLARESGISITERPINAINSATYARDLAAEIQTRSGGKSVLVVGHSNTVPDIVKALSGITVPPIADDEYDHLFIVTVSGSGAPRLMRQRFGAPCCSAQPAAGGGSMAESEVRAAMSRFLDALNALDVTRMDAAFTDDVTAFVPTARPDEAVGRPAVTAIFRAFADRLRPSTPRLNIAPEDERVSASSTLGVVTFQVRDKDPSVTRRRTFVFRRTGDSWLISHFHASDITPAAPPVVDSLVLERTPCFGFCPAYRLRVTSAGEVHFQSRNSGDQKRMAIAAAAASTLSLLVSRARAAGFYEFPDVLRGDSVLCPVAATDHPTAIVTIYSAAQTKRVEDYHGCRGGIERSVATRIDRLRAFEQEIDSVLRSSRWVTRPSRR